MAIQIDTVVNDETRTILEQSLESLNSNIGDKITTDYNDFTTLGLFSSQLNDIKKGIDTLAESHEKFIEIIKENKREWENVEKEVEEEVKKYTDDVETTNRTRNNKVSSSNSGSSGSSNGGSVSNSGTQNGYQYQSQNTEDVDHGTGIKVVSLNDVTTTISNLNAITSAILLKKLLKENNNQSITDLLIDPEKSGILVALLRTILGDTSEISGERTTETDNIQKALLEKLGIKVDDTTTEEEKSEIDKAIIEKLKRASEDETQWNEMIYGDNTRIIDILGGEYVVVKTTTDVEAYEKYAIGNGVKQDANTAEWGDSCLAFAGAHAYDMYAGTQTGGQSAANYANGGKFEDFMDDDKSVVLAKVYDEIMNGRPVVIQVNGNKQGTSRHFVAVVGFKKGVTSAESLTEEDLLIMDSWDGKIERMDTETSRFMTSGKDCRKDYTGYRLRVLKQSSYI